MSNGDDTDTGTDGQMTEQPPQGAPVPAGLRNPMPLSTLTRQVQQPQDPNRWRLVSNTPWGGDAGPAFDRPQPQMPSMWGGRGGGLQSPLQDLVQRFLPQQQEQGTWRSPYRMSSPREIGQIGQTWWPIDSAANYPGGDAGPMMPSPLEALHVMGGAGNWLRQFASPGIGQYYGRASQLAMQLAPMLDMMSKGAFSKNYWAARSGRLKEMQEEMLLNTEMGLQHHQEELNQYREIIDTFNLGGFSKDPQQNEDIANQKLEELAQTDPMKLATLKNVGIKGLNHLLTEEDRRFRDMAAGYTSAKKAKDATGSESAFEDGGTDGTTTARTEIRHPDISPTPRTDTPDTGGMTTDQQKVDAQIRKDHNNLSENAMEDARRLFRGEVSYKKDLVPKYGDKGAGAIDGAANQMRSMMDKVANRPDDPNKSVDENRDAKLKEIEAIDPDRGTMLRRLTDYDLSPKDFSIRDQLRTQIEQQAMRIDPSYKPDLFDRIHKLRSDSRDPDHQTLMGAAQLNESSYQVLKALKPFEESPTIPSRILADLIANKYTGNDKYSRLYAALNQYALATSRFAGGGNRVPVTFVQNMLKHMSETNSPAQIRAQLQVDNNDAWARVDEIQSGLKEETGRDIKMPGFPTAPAAGIDAVRKMTSATGEMPEDAPDRFKAVGKTPSASDRPDWRTKKDEESPLGVAEGTAMMRAIEENKNNPAMAQKVQQLREILAKHGWY